MKTDLSVYTVGDYDPGPRVKRVLWYLVNYGIFNSAVPFPSAMKCGLLRLFGCPVGKGVVIKPKVRIKYPWKLKMGDYCWLGEDVWIDNVAPVTISSQVVLSQGAVLLTGNHNYKLSHFPLVTGTILLEDGVWIAANAIVCPGVTCRSHSVLAVASVATKELAAYKVYAGNPAVEKGNRI